MRGAGEEQNVLVVATVAGQPVTDLPPDLFIPPDALEVLLESFTGPLDLLLYLIRRQNLDILDIPIALITRQYMQYIQLMENSRLELAADYLVMAAMLAEIKSRMLLPPTPNSEEDEDDPRSLLVKKLQLYEQFKQAAINIDLLARNERDFFRVKLGADGLAQLILHPDIELSMLQEAYLEVLQTKSHSVSHQIMREPLSVRERMVFILEKLEVNRPVSLSAFYKKAEGRMGLAVALLAILELARQSLILIIQPKIFEQIYIQGVEDG